MSENQDSFSRSVAGISMREQDMSFGRQDGTKFMTSRVPQSLSASQLQTATMPVNSSTTAPSQSIQQRSLLTLGPASQLLAPVGGTGLMQLQQENSRQTDTILTLQRRIADLQSSKDLESRNYEASIGELKVEISKISQERDDALTKIEKLNIAVNDAKAVAEKAMAVRQEDASKIKDLLGQRDKAEIDLHVQIDSLRAENIRLDAAAKQANEDLFALQNVKRDLELRLNKVIAEREEQGFVIKKLQTELLDAQTSFKQQTERFNEQTNSATEKTNNLQNENYSLNEKINTLVAEKARLEDTLASQNNELQLQLDDIKFANEKLKKKLEKEKTRSAERETFYTNKIEELLSRQTTQQNNENTQVEQENQSDGQSKVPTLKYYQDTLAASEAMVESLRKELDASGASFQAQLETHQRISKVKINELETLLEQAKQRSDDLQMKLKEINQQYLDVKKENNTLRHSNEVVQSKCDALELKSSTQIDDLTKQLNRLNEDNRSLKGQFDALSLQATTDTLNAQQAYEALSNEHEDLKTQYAMLKDTTEQSNALLEKRLEDKEQEINETRMELDDTRQRLAKLNEDLAALDTSRKHIEDLEIRNFDLENEANELKSQLEALKAENTQLNSTLEKVQADVDETKAVSAINESLKRQLERANERITSLDNQLKQALADRSSRAEQHSAQTAQMAEEYKRLQLELQDVSDKYASEAQSSAKLQVRLKHVEARYAEVTALFGVSDGDNDQEDKSIPSIATSIAALKTRLNEAESSLSVTENALRISQANESGLKEQLATARQRLSSVEAERETLRAKYTRKRQQYSSTKEEIERLTQELEEANERIAANQKNEMTKGRSALERKAGEADALKTEIEQLRQRNKEAEAELSELRKRISLISVECEEKIAQTESTAKLQAGELQNKVFHLRSELDQKQQDIQELNDTVAHQKELRRLAEDAARDVRNQLEKAIDEREKLTLLVNEQAKTLASRESETSEKVRALMDELEKQTGYSTNLRVTCDGLQSNNEMLEGENQALTNRCATLTDQVASLQAHLTTEHEKRMRTKANAKQTKSSLEEKIQEITTELQSANSALTILESQLSDAKSTSDISKEQASNLGEQLSTLQNKTKIQENRIKQLEEENESLQRNKENSESDYDQQIKSLKNKLNELEKKSNESEEKNKSLSDLLKKKNEEASMFSEKANSLSSRVLDLEKSLDETRINHENQINQCKQLVTDLKADIRSRQERCNQLEEEIDRLTADVANKTVLAELEGKKGSAGIASAKRQIDALTTQMNDLLAANSQYKTQIKASQELIQLLQRQIDNNIGNKSSKISTSTLSGTARSYNQQIAQLKEENVALRASLDEALRTVAIDDSVKHVPLPTNEDQEAEREANEALVLELNGKVLFLESELSALEKRLRDTRDQQEAELEVLHKTVTDLMKDEDNNSNGPNAQMTRNESGLRAQISILEADVRNKAKKVEALEIQLRRLEALGDPVRLSDQLKEEQEERRNETEAFQRELLDIRQRVEREAAAYKSQISALQGDLMETRAQLNYFKKRVESSNSAAASAGAAASSVAAGAGVSRLPQPQPPGRRL